MPSLYLLDYGGNGSQHTGISSGSSWLERKSLKPGTGYRESLTSRKRFHTIVRPCCRRDWCHDNDGSMKGQQGWLNYTIPFYLDLSLVCIPWRWLWGRGCFFSCGHIEINLSLLFTIIFSFNWPIENRWPILNLGLPQPRLWPLLSVSLGYYTKL